MPKLHSHMSTQSVKKNCQYIHIKCIYNDSTGEKKIAWILKLSINRSISIICNWILRNCGFTRVYLSIRQFVACIWRLSHALQFTLHMFIWRDVTRHYNIIAIWWTYIVVLDWTHDGGRGSVLATNGMLLGLDFGIQKKLLAFHCSATEAKMLVPGSQVISFSQV